MDRISWKSVMQPDLVIGQHLGETLKRTSCALSYSGRFKLYVKGIFKRNFKSSNKPELLFSSEFVDEHFI